MATTFETKLDIIADLWMNFRQDEEFQDFVEYNDLGLPLSYAALNGIATLSPAGQKMIEETFDLLLASMDIQEDVGFESLDDIFGYEL